MCTIKQNKSPHICIQKLQPSLRLDFFLINAETIMVSSWNSPVGIARKDRQGVWVLAGVICWSELSSALWALRRLFPLTRKAMSKDNSPIKPTFSSILSSQSPVFFSKSPSTPRELSKNMDEIAAIDNRPPYHRCHALKPFSVAIPDASKTATCCALFGTVLLAICISDKVAI